MIMYFKRFFGLCINIYGGSSLIRESVAACLIE